MPPAKGCRGLEGMLPPQQLLAGGERPAEQRPHPLASAASEQQTGSQGACIAASGPSPSHQPSRGQQQQPPPQQQQQLARPPPGAVLAARASTEAPARLQLGTRLAVAVAAQQDAPSSSMATVLHGVQVAQGQVTRVAEETAHWVYVEALLEGEAEPRPLYLIKVCVCGRGRGVYGKVGAGARVVALGAVWMPPAAHHTGPQ